MFLKKKNSPTSEIKKEKTTSIWGAKRKRKKKKFAAEGEGGKIEKNKKVPDLNFHAPLKIKWCAPFKEMLVVGIF